MSEPASHCPANKAADILGDKWTLLIIRAMVLGARRYSDFTAAIPRISPSVLSGRLKSLSENGLIMRKGETGQQATYRLTPSGRDAMPIVIQLAEWGLKWAKRNTRVETVDVGAMMWDFHRTILTEELPDGETVLAYRLTDLDKHDRWWMVVCDNEVDLCDHDPGKPVDLYINGPLDAIVDAWTGEADLNQLLRDEQVVVTGERILAESVNHWFPMSPVARAKKAGASF